MAVDPMETLLGAGQGDKILKIIVDGPVVADNSVNPATIPAGVYFYGFPNTTDAPRITRTFRFERGNGQWQVNGQLVGGCNQAPRFRIKRNTVEKWIFQNNSGGWQHPIHMHFEEFQTLSINGNAPSGTGLITKGRKDGIPMAMLEDVLVPVYLYHRYQVEAVTKLVGGMNYSYALRGDGQMITQSVSKEEQLKALNAVIGTIDPSVLVLPERIIKLIPPRPAGYNYTRELFQKRTGLAFDALSPAEMAADLSLSFLFKSERMNRLVEYQIQYGGLGLNEMTGTLIATTWKAPRRKGMEGSDPVANRTNSTHLFTGSQY